MPTLEENLALARTLVSELKATNVCSHDIIARENLPFVLIHEFPIYIKKFGPERFKLFMGHNHQTKAIRAEVTNICHRLSVPFPIMTRSLAVAALGYGECQELASKITTDLINHDRFDSALVMLEGLPDERYSGYPHLHALNILGIDPDKHAPETLGIQSIEDFQKLPASAVVIDPLLGYVGLAHNYQSDNHAYLNSFKFHKIGEWRTFDPYQKVSLNTIQFNAQKISIQMTAKGFLPCDRSKLDALRISKTSTAVASGLPSHPVKIFDIKASHQADVAFTAKVKRWEANSGRTLSDFFAHTTIEDFFSAPLPAELEEIIKPNTIPSL
jgi:hypothetical protein